MNQQSVTIPYGNQQLNFSLPTFMEVNVRTPGEKEWSSLSSDAIREHLADVVGPVLDGLPSHPELVLAIPDHTREAHQNRIVEQFVHFLNERIKERSFLLTILIASGRHQPPDADQIDSLIPEDVQNQSHITLEIHDAFSEDALVSTGNSLDGTPVRLNRTALSADGLILYGLVKFHYLAGYGGGPKMLCPGLGGDETITAVHRRSFIDDSSRDPSHIGPGSFQNNPMQEAIQQIYKDLDFNLCIGIQGILNVEGELAHLYSGEVMGSHQKAIQKYSDRFVARIDGTYDLILASPGGSPHDIDLVQSNKTLQHINAVLQDQTTHVLLFAACRDGFGSDVFREWLQKGKSTTIRRALREEFQVYGRTAMALKQIDESVNLRLVTELDREQLRNAGLADCSFPQEWIEGFEQEHGSDSLSVLCLPEAAQMLVE